MNEILEAIGNIYKAISDLSDRVKLLEDAVDLLLEEKEKNKYFAIKII